MPWTRICGELDLGKLLISPDFTCQEPGSKGGHAAREILINEYVDRSEFIGCKCSSLPMGLKAKSVALGLDENISADRSQSRYLKLHVTGAFFLFKINTAPDDVIGGTSQLFRNISFQLRRGWLGLSREDGFAGSKLSEDVVGLEGF